MGKTMKKALCFIMAAIMIFGNAGTVFAAESEEQSLEEIIRPQIEAFAKSIDQKDADGAATDILISHGISGNGKKLSVGKSSALTATLMNGELAKEYLTVLCADLVKTADELDMNKIYSLGAVFWQIKSTNFYYFKLYNYNPSVSHNKNGEFTFPKDHFKKVGEITFDKSNEYDETLEVIVGGTCLDIDLEIDKIYSDKIIYNVSVIFMDVFNFDTDNSSTLEDLLGFIGLLFFEPFEWESKVDFQIEIPNDCEHSFGEWKTAAEPNCTENGMEERTCPNCGCVDTKETAALGHSFGEWAVETEPSCTESGTERRDCNNCEHYETKEIAPKGHSFGEWYESKVPTYTEEGEERRDCANCGHFETRTLAALDYLLGDLNGDEKINVLDANLVRRYAAELEELDKKKLAAADVNGDGKVNVLDANLIRRFAAKLISNFPVEE
ncbi:MAG: dockerin type I repeat-containing protein [Oscillospiraceae bacterium]|nr:dockerin type I repeat-containing protein [Oscillospiraceae bacterium]